ncbi:MAG: ATP-dependent protease, Lon family [Firmicutes bacterium]|nr:ATP-dependent protease, Lon family [Bacillota bacterium]
MQKNKKNVLQEFPGRSRDGLKQRVKSFYDMLSEIYGADKLILKAIKLEALSLIRSKQLAKRVLGLQKIILEDPTMEKVPSLAELPSILDQLEEKAADYLAHRTFEESLEQKISRKLQEKHEEYIREVKKQLLKEEGGPENPQTLKKYAWVEKMHSTSLSGSAMDFLRPSSLEEIVGQEKGIRALMSKLASPFPQHLIIYGPPGIGKTAAARLALEAAKKMPDTPFSPEAPFVEVDATTLRWDPRETTNPLLGSVHDPIYQGARRDLSEGGIPEPKPGLVTEAHTGVLFIDEIGEMDPYLQSKLLKVLEDKKVFFDSAYYDPSDPQIPKYIRKLFEEGAPADFILVGATTRSPDDISPALRSRCSAVYFEPLSPENIIEIVKNAAKKLKVEISHEAAVLISRNTSEGRKSVNLLADAYGLARYMRYLDNLDRKKQKKEKDEIYISEELVKEVIRSNRLVPAVLPETSVPQVGKIHGLAAAGYLGSILEIEVVSFPAAEAGKGKIRFNEAAGTMARDSVYNAASVLRKLTGVDISAYDLHFNVVGGGNIDGPSAGAALFLALYSALMQIPLRQDIAVSGELSLQGKIKPVGGLFEKLYGARVAGIKIVCLPGENQCELPTSFQDMEIIYVDCVEELLSKILVRECSR